MINELIEMLGYCRPAGSDTERDFIAKYLTPLGCYFDDAGNVIKIVGNNTSVIWSSHTDTVHRNEGIVSILVDNDFARVDLTTGATCLGADCTTGVWVMMQMIRAEVPGLYIFHRAEEVGCVGSRHISKHSPTLLANAKMAIAFDRYGTNSIITHQMAERCCSDEFTDSLADQLWGFKGDDGGSFTDTYSYIDQIPECTNISVGYYNQHTTSENQDLLFAKRLADKMTKIDTSKLVVKRDPSVTEYCGWGSMMGYGYGHRSETSYLDHYDDWMSNDSRVGQGSFIPKGRVSLTSLVKDHPDEAADMLDMLGIGVTDFQDYIEQNYYGGNAYGG